MRAMIANGNEAIKTVEEIVANIGNVILKAEVDGVLYTLAADAVVRTHDADEGLLITCLRYASQEAAAAAYATSVAAAEEAA